MKISNNLSRNIRYIKNNRRNKVYMARQKLLPSKTSEIGRVIWKLLERKMVRKFSILLKFKMGIRKNKLVASKVRVLMHKNLIQIMKRKIRLLINSKVQLASRP